MRWSRTFIPTLRENPAGVLHRGYAALLRGGYLRRADDIGHLYFPLYIRVREKLSLHLERIMTRAGGIPIAGAWSPPVESAGHCPANPAADSRTLICRVAGNELRSYRQLPLTLFYRHNHQPLEFADRDEHKPIDARDWITAHTFASSPESLAKTQESLVRDVLRFCKNIGLLPVIAAIESGNRGLFVTSEALPTAEGILCCNMCDYAASAAVAEGKPATGPGNEIRQKIQRVVTPGAKTVEQVTALLGVGAAQLIKTLLYKSERGVIAALIRGDRTVHEDKLRLAAGVSELQLLEADEIQELTGAVVGFSGPFGLSGVRLIADAEIPLMRNAVVGGNEDDIHLMNVDPGDLEFHLVADIRRAMANDYCPKCPAGLLGSRSGTLLGIIVSSDSNADPPFFFDNEEGRESPAIVGDFHLNLTDLLLTAAATHSDSRGLIWPEMLAPYPICLMAVNPDNQQQWQITEKLETELLAAGVDVLHDDRRARIGGRFKDVDLLGIPLRIVVGPKGLQDNTLDLEWRREGHIEKISIPEAAGYVKKLLQPEVHKPATH